MSSYRDFQIDAQFHNDEDRYCDDDDGDMNPGGRFVPNGNVYDTQSNNNDYNSYPDYNTNATAAAPALVDLENHANYAVPARNSYLSLLRWLILAFCCVLTLGSYFCYDNPGALRVQLLDYPFIGGPNGDNINRFQTFYTVYSVPNTFMVFFGGLLIDKFFGIRLGSFIYTFLTMLGAVIFALGITMGQANWNYIVMVIGRFVFGLGGESISVGQSVFIAKWFAGKELSLAFGISLAISRVSSALALDVVTPIGTKAGVPAALWVGAAICVLSVVVAVLAGSVDKFGEKKGVVGKDTAASDPMSLSDIKKFPLTLYILLLLCITFYVPFFNFTSVATDFFTTQYGFKPNVASSLASIPLWVSAVCLPIFGFIVDRIRRGPYLILMATISLLCSLLGVLFIHYKPVATANNATVAVTIIVMLIMGLAYSFFASTFWPCVPLVVEKNAQGTAYGLLQAGQNAGMAIASVIIGAMQSRWGTSSPYHWNSVNFFFIGNTAIAVGLSVWLILADAARGFKLSKPPSKQPVSEYSTTIAAVAASEESSINNATDKTPLLKQETTKTTKTQQRQQQQ